MPVAPACYGRQGPQAADNPRVAELLQRTVDGQYRATTAFRATFDSLTAKGAAPWTGPIASLTLLLHQWITLLAWERATVFVDAAVAADPAMGDSTYRQADKVADEATDLSMRSIRMQTEVEQGKRPGNAALTALPLVAGNPANIPMVWASLEAVFTRVRADLFLIAEIGVPPRMGKVYRSLLESYQPKATLFEYLQSQWNSAASNENRVQCVRQATPLAQHLYTVGQQIWAPYLAGPVYINIVRSYPLFAKLNLPFDPWILTDPAEVDARVTDRTSCEQLIAFWQTIAEQSAARALQDQIAEALAAESIAIETGRSFKIAPWHPRYRVLHDVSVGGQQLQAGATFTIYPRTVDGKRILEIRVTE